MLKIDTICAADLYGIYKASQRKAVVNPIRKLQHRKSKGKVHHSN